MGGCICAVGLNDAGGVRTKRSEEGGKEKEAHKDEEGNELLEQYF